LAYKILELIGGGISQFFSAGQRLKQSLERHIVDLLMLDTIIILIKNVSPYTRELKVVGNVR
jgi:hypothetical protein